MSNGGGTSNDYLVFLAGYKKSGYDPEFDGVMIGHQLRGLFPKNGVDFRMKSLRKASSAETAVFAIRLDTSP